MPTLVIRTPLGSVRLELRPDAAPQTVAYISKCVRDGLYDGRAWYRSDFVIQCGLHGSGVHNPNGNLQVNETHTGPKVSNTRGTAAIAHFDSPDNGNTEFFVNLQANAHLDSVYGGYCVFAEVRDFASFAVVDAIAREVKGGAQTAIISMTIEE
ncbi:cyclophilin-like domain-containing protein [Pavlovales sp. CCMP2436]|nr:cyclophilin-like domain-containing protein [Pavlovales sp. CCMP2436]